MVSSIWSSISICFFVLFIGGIGAIRRDASWTIKLTPSYESANDYEGVLEILAVFKDGKQHSIILPSTIYSKGKPAIFDVGFVSPGPLQMIYLRTHGVCPIGLLPLNVLRLLQIELFSNDVNTTYTKFVRDLAIKDLCQNNKSLGTALKDFDEFNPQFCLIDGKKYNNGEQFDLGCTARCTCLDGRYGCVDMCPAVAWSPERKCHYVHEPGQCCSTVRCENDEQINSCDSKIVGDSSSDVGTRAPAPVRRYPWSVLLCVDSKCSQVYGGVIVGVKHILTYAPDLTAFPDLRFIAGQYIAGPSNASDFSPLRIVNISAHSDFVNPESPIADSGSRLQLLQIDSIFNFDKQIQAANLPFNKNQCSQLSKDQCPLTTVGWDRTDDQDGEIRQWFLHAEKSTIDQQACNRNSTARSHPKTVNRGPRRRGDSRLCLNGLSRSDCTGPLGGAIVSNRGTVDFLVGILDPDSALFACVNQGTASMLPLCNYVDWIASRIFSS